MSSNRWIDKQIVVRNGLYLVIKSSDCWYPQKHEQILKWYRVSEAKQERHILWVHLYMQNSWKMETHQQGRKSDEPEGDTWRRAVGMKVWEQHGNDDYVY